MMVWCEDGAIHSLIIDGVVKEVIKYEPNHCFTDRLDLELGEDLNRAKRIVEYRYRGLVNGDS